METTTHPVAETSAQSISASLTAQQIIEAARAAAASPGEPAAVPHGLIDPGKNPREHFEPEAMAEMEESIRAVGILQSLLVRRKADGRYELIAGERRLRSFRAVYPDPATPIPVLIRNFSDEMAAAAALVENDQREPMTPLEEAEQAAKILAEASGDHAEAARRLGWKVHQLRVRLGLMQANTAVRQALRKQIILVGHAELLAALRTESQDQALAMLTAVTPRTSVTEFKAMIERMALPLGKAIFNKDGCTDCLHNSGNQKALFGEVIADGNCTNRLCYDTKTEVEIERRANALREDYQVVRIVRPGEDLAVVDLEATGTKGVGAEQAQACRTCKSFGATVSARPDSLGQTSVDQCMDTACNVRMVAKRIRSELPPAAPAGTNAASTNGRTTGTTPSPSKKLASAEPSTAMRTYREEIWRAVLTKVVQSADMRVNRCVLLAYMLTGPNVISDHVLGEVVSVKTGAAAKPGEVLAKLLKLETGQLATDLQHVAASTGNGLSITNVAGMLTTLGVQLEEHWVIDQVLLSKLTKNEIDAVCQELGIKKAMGESYAKALTGKKDDYIKAVLGIEGFTYRGLVPKTMMW